MASPGSLPCDRTDRRAFVCAALILAASAGHGQAQPAAGTSPRDVIRYRGFAIDVSAIATWPNRAAIVTSLNRQIDIFLSVGLSDDQLAFFRGVAVTLVAGLGHGRYRRAQGVEIGAQEMNSGMPVLLHEFVHAFHYERLPNAGQNADVITFYNRAKASGAYPAQSYMLSNPQEFFAMTATAVLVGRVQREPFTRDKVKEAQPVYFRWLLDQFRLTEATLRRPPG